MVDLGALQALNNTRGNLDLVCWIFDLAFNLVFFVFGTNFATGLSMARACALILLRGEHCDCGEWGALRASIQRALQEQFQRIYGIGSQGLGEQPPSHP
jgi:hypothetical protein